MTSGGIRGRRRDGSVRRFLVVAGFPIRETHAGTEQRNRGTRAHAVHRTDALFRRRRRARADQQSVLRTIIRR